MRILHTSDWHLGRTLEGRTRIEEQREFMDELCTILESESINLVLVAGDVFDTYNPSAEAEKVFYEALERISGNGRRAVVVIAGNHDSPDRLHAANPLAYKQGIFLLGYPGEDLSEELSAFPVIEEAAASTEESAAAPKRISRPAGGPGWLELSVPGCAENAVIACLPYPSEQRLNDILSLSLEDEDMQKAYSERVAAAFQQASANYRDDTVNLAVSHLFVLGGMSSDSEREIQLGGAYVVEPAAMPAKAHYVALGHLHRPQAVGGTPVPCRYSGSPLCYSFSETDQQKEVVLIEARPGFETIIKQIRLTAGKPMRLLRFADYEQACDWCSADENKNTWADIQIQSPQPLTSQQVAELRKIHAGIINVRVILPGLNNEENSGPRLSELPLEVKFSRFVARETGTAPQQELIDLLLDLLDGSENLEAS